ncbi:hypothetical protein [Stratiformator vulcanicus]|uniref:Uncharacterized protein n=1 Tax=Stratiformator vulcanicus TaxID=2527980 RepID=A0A517R749_9PLAN|nr:hypothetical protein [Stratiformator vulcanicus]QDT39714.1 hypothetical protein Pan189_41230 [Stratiformator vulcanicus]
MSDAHLITNLAVRVVVAIAFVPAWTLPIAAADNLTIGGVVALVVGSLGLIIGGSLGNLAARLVDGHAAPVSADSGPKARSIAELM